MALPEEVEFALEMEKPYSNVRLYPEDNGWTVIYDKAYDRLGKNSIIFVKKGDTSKALAQKLVFGV
jgi:hypothetical protein